MRYAQIDELKIVIGISELSGEINVPDMILIDDYPQVTIGWRYINEIWEEPEPDPIDPIETYTPYTNEELAYMQHNQIRAQNRQISGEIGTTKAKTLENLDPTEEEIYKEDLHMYTKGFKNKDFSATTVYQAVEMGEIYPQDYTDITSIEYVAPVMTQPTNAEIQGNQFLLMELILGVE